MTNCKNTSDMYLVTILLFEETMEYLNVNSVKEMLIAASSAIIEKEPYLTKIDTIIGDGDHGSGMKRGFSALKSMLEQSDFKDLWSLLRQSGMELVKTMGGASGVLFGTLLIGGLNAVEGKDTLSAKAAAEYFAGGTKAVMERGKASLGQKTMLDALVPAVEAMRTAARDECSLEKSFEAAVMAANDGVEKTIDMVSMVGRSKNFREHTLGTPDPGAVSVATILTAMHKYIKENE